MREWDSDLDIWQMSHYYFVYKRNVWILKRKLRQICDRWDEKLLIDWAESHQNQQRWYAEAYAQDEDLFDQMARLNKEKMQYDDLVKPKIEGTFEWMTQELLTKDSDKSSIIASYQVAENFSFLNVVLFHGVQCLLKITDECQMLDEHTTRAKYQQDIINEAEQFFEGMPDRDFFDVLKFPFWLETVKCK